MMSRSLNCDHCSYQLIKSVIFVIILGLVCESLFWPKTTRFCFNSQEPQRLNSQCVYCNFFNFGSMTLGCTGTSALSQNITTDQAFCIISNCLSQVKQTPIWLGRKRRDVVDRIPSDEEVASVAAQMELDQQQPLEDLSDFENYHDAINKHVNETIIINYNGVEQRVEVVNQVTVDVEN